MADRVSGCNHLNIKKEIIITATDLPLHCPMNDSAGWCSHPRVFLAIELSKTKSIRCPYCSTKYRLSNET
jgi:uncharacterized Zn-finger protein